MALGTWLAGRFSSTYDPPGGTAATDLGIMEGGYELSWRLSGEAIKETDQYGEMFLDLIYRGLSDVFVQCNCMEAKTGPLLAATPFGAMAQTGSTTLSPGIISRLMSDMAGVWIATATTGAPAVSSPATLTATYTHLAENVDVTSLMNSKLRKIPLRFRVLPYLDTTIKFLTAT